MNKFTEEEKQQLIRFADKAEEHFFKYVSFCEKIAVLLDEKNPDEKHFMKDVLYQMSDGICVRYEEPDFKIAANIPILHYLDGNRQ